MIEFRGAAMTSPGRANARERILDAALAVAERVGAAHLTLDAVAAEAGVSKGGLLYHFASKDALLGGMVDHHMDLHRRSLDAARLRYPDTPGGYLQAYVDAQVEDRNAGIHEPHAVRSFIAAAVNTPDLMERPRQLHAEHVAALRASGAGFVDALLVSLALDGLFFCEAFELLDLAPEETAAVIRALKERAAALAAPGGR